MIRTPTSITGFLLSIKQSDFQTLTLKKGGRWLISSGNSRLLITFILLFPDPNQGLGDGVGGWSGVFQSPLPHLIGDQCVRRTLIDTPARSNHSEECPRHQKPFRAAVWQREHFNQHTGQNKQPIFNSFWSLGLQVFLLGGVTTSF